MTGESGHERFDVFVAALERAGRRRFIGGPQPSTEVLSADLDRFAVAYPTVRRGDPAWHRFLTTVGGATFVSDRQDLVMLGFDVDTAPIFLDDEDEAPIFDETGRLLCFADSFDEFLTLIVQSADDWAIHLPPPT